jgi:hypothetical protein
VKKVGITKEGEYDVVSTSLLCKKKHFTRHELWHKFAILNCKLKIKKEESLMKFIITEHDGKKP